MRLRAASAVLIVAPLALTLAACGGGSKSASGPVTLRLGYFPNVTHATAIVGVQDGIFAKDLGPDKLKTATFNAGGDEVTALFSGALDAGYIGPNNAVNAYLKAKGTAASITVISGATSGGAALVVKPSITTVAELKGKKLATPQLGNTQDVALRTYLKDNGLKTDTSGGGDVSIEPQANATALAAFEAGSIDGAWVPEPWATQLVQKGGGHVLVNEASLWPQGKFVTTELIVNTSFLKKHPDTVKRLLQGQIEANTFVNANPVKAQELVNQGIKAITGKELSTKVIQAAWKDLTFTNDPISSSQEIAAQHAEALGFIKSSDLTGISDFTILNELLKADGQPEVQ